MKPIALSHSRIKDFRTCPRMFYELHVTRAVSRDPSSPALVRGNQVHKALEDYIKERKPLSTDLERFGALVDSLREAGAVLAERKFAFTDTWQPVGFFDKDVAFRGIADVLVLPPEGHDCLILDWKTGKRRNNPEQLRLMGSCVLLAYQNLKSADTAFVWVDQEIPFDSIVVTRDDAEAVIDDVEAVKLDVARCQSENLWPTRPTTNNCRWCPAKRICLDAAG